MWMEQVWGLTTSNIYPSVTSGERTFPLGSSVLLQGGGGAKKILQQLDEEYNLDHQVRVVKGMIVIDEGGGQKGVIPFFMLATRAHVALSASLCSSLGWGAGMLWLSSHAFHKGGGGGA